MAGVIDTNVLLYAANRNAARHERAFSFLIDAGRSSSTWYLTDGIVYEFLRVSTHPRVFPAPLHASDAISFLHPMLSSPRFALLSAGPRHWSLLSEVTGELRNPSGNLFFDIRTVALMREHGVRRIYTADTDFLQFEGIDVQDPVKGR
ncbi:MAG: PIN domain-containing protein [Burkholderiaceae bacterium]|jgi:toxin-antitoxin system PIN domain toxin|nr:PIN domain-containing protein [Burkholderiaceae bacterium]MEB2349849.1 PIN domain-containing protein [Burkholderiaceae bacterium]